MNETQSRLDHVKSILLQANSYLQKWGGYAVSAIEEQLEENNPIVPYNAFETLDSIFYSLGSYNYKS